MNPLAVAKARARLESAKKAFASMAKATSFAEFEPLWTDFLLASNSIYSVLEQGAKTNATARQWFGGKKKQRRDDNLLRYLHQARNADEHGIAPVAKDVPGSVGVGVEGDGGLIVHEAIISSDGIRGRFETDNGSPVRVTITRPHAELVTVHDDRFGDSVDPPTKHQGKPLESNLPGDCATLALDYYEALVREAEQRWGDANDIAKNTP